MSRYPLVYSIMVVPKSVTRVIQLATKSTPGEETLAFQMFYSLIGFMDVVLFFKTRRGLLLFDENLEDEEEPEKSRDESINQEETTDI
jgi:hypothetical protein